MNRTRRAPARTLTLTRRTAMMGLGAPAAAALLAAERTSSPFGLTGSIVAGQETGHPEQVITGNEYSFEQPAEVAAGFTMVTLMSDRNH